LAADVNILFDNKNLDNIKFISSILLIFWLLSLPIIFFYIYFKRKDELFFKKIEGVFGFLLHEYKKMYFYWEIQKTYILKFTIIIVIEFTDNDLIIRSSSILIIAFIYYITITYNKPYK
jgi:hypothetical protein